VGLAAGCDFRREQLGQRPDARGVSGDIIGESPRAQTNAQRKIGGIFAEVRVPLPARLELSASGRHEKFFSSGREATVPKAALRWQPIAGQLTLRSSASKGFREPSLYELYSTPTSALYPIQDPRDGFIEPEQPITLRGNRRLAAEKTDYFNAGFVWSPTRPKLKGLSLGADFWRVTRIGTVEANPQNTVARAFGVLPGGLFPGESVSLTNAGYIGTVNSVFFNVGQTKVEGWDFSGGYQLPTDSLGRWEVTTIWTLVTRFDRSAVAGAPLQSVLGQDSSGTGDNGYLKVKGRVNLHWNYRGFGVYFAGNYTDGFRDTDPSGTPYQVADRFLVDGQVSYTFRGRPGALLRDTKLSLGAQNLFDRDPPKSYGSGGNSTGYPGFLYTAENCFWYVAISRKF
jgi:iron complex outermembrane receptor protein